MREVLQAVWAEISEGRCGGQAPFDQRSSGVGKKDLPTMRRRGDSGASVDIQTEIVVAAYDPLSCVESHPYSDDNPFRPWCCSEFALGTDGGADRPAGRGEYR
jgi:hypothetical protein